MHISANAFNFKIKVYSIDNSVFLKLIKGVFSPNTDKTYKTKLSINRAIEFHIICVPLVQKAKKINKH